MTCAFPISLVYVFLLAGLLLLGGMVWQVGMTDLLTSFGVVGWWIVPWVLWKLCLWCCTRLDQVFFFVPGGLGTFEGSRFTILSTLGVAQVSGLACGPMARLEGLVWNSFGLLAYAWYTRTGRGLRRVQPLASSSTPAPPTPC